jgi:hypothetical protein
MKAESMRKSKEVATFIVNLIKDKKWEEAKALINESRDTMLIWGSSFDVAGFNSDILELSAYHGVPDDFLQHVYAIYKGKLSDTRPMIFAAIGGNLDTMKWLKNFGEDVNQYGLYGTTSVHEATLLNDVEIVKWLLDNGANLQMTNVIQRTPLQCAAVEGSLDVMKLLLEKGAPLEEKDLQYKTAFALAVFFDEYDCAKLLLDKGADINTTAELDATCLHVAAFHGELKQSVFLLKNGMNEYMLDNRGNTAVMLIGEGEDITLHEYLLLRQERTQLKLLCTAREFPNKHLQSKVKLLSRDILVRLKEFLTTKFKLHHQGGFFYPVRLPTLERTMGTVS